MPKVLEMKAKVSAKEVTPNNKLVRELAQQAVKGAENPEAQKMLRNQHVINALKEGRFENISKEDVEKLKNVMNDLSLGQYIEQYEAYVKDNSKNSNDSEGGFFINGFAKTDAEMDNAILDEKFEKELAKITHDEKPFVLNDKGELANSKNKRAYQVLGNAQLIDGRTGKVVSKEKRQQFIGNVVKANKYKVLAAMTKDIDKKEFITNAEKRKAFAREFSKKLSKSLNSHADSLVEMHKADLMVPLAAKKIELEEKKKRKDTPVSTAQIDREIAQIAKAAEEVKKIDGTKPFKVDMQTAYMSVIDQVKSIDKALTNSKIATAIRKFEKDLEKKNKVASFAYTLGRDIAVTAAVAVPTGFVGLAVLGGVRTYNEYKKQKRLYNEGKDNGQIVEASFKEYRKANKRVRNTVRNKAIFAGLTATFAGASVVMAGYEAVAENGATLAEGIKTGIATNAGLVGAAAQGKLQAMNEAMSTLSFDKVWENISQNAANFKQAIASNITARGAVFGATGLALGADSASLEFKNKNYGRAGIALLGGTAGALAAFALPGLLKDSSGFVPSTPDLNASNGGDYTVYNMGSGNKVVHAGILGFGGNDDNGSNLLAVTDRLEDGPSYKNWLAQADTTDHSAGDTNVTIPDNETPMQYEMTFHVDDQTGIRSAKSVYMLMGGNKGLAGAQERANALINNPANIALAGKMSEALNVEISPAQTAHMALLDRLVYGKNEMLLQASGCQESDVIQHYLDIGKKFNFDVTKGLYGDWQGAHDPCILGHVEIDDCKDKVFVEDICGKGKKGVPTPIEVVEEPETPNEPCIENVYHDNRKYFKYETTIINECCPEEEIVSTTPVVDTPEKAPVVVITNKNVEVINEVVSKKDYNEATDILKNGEDAADYALKQHMQNTH